MRCSQKAPTRSPLLDPGRAQFAKRCTPGLAPALFPTSFIRAAAAGAFGSGDSFGGIDKLLKFANTDFGAVNLKTVNDLHRLQGLGGAKGMRQIKQVFFMLLVVF